MAIRNIIKHKAVMEDLYIGVGTTKQKRDGSQYVVGKIDIPYSVESVAAMQAVDINDYVHVRLYLALTQYADYIYDPNNTSGFPSDHGDGSWVPVQSDLTYSTQTLELPEGDTTLTFNFDLTGATIEVLADHADSGPLPADDYSILANVLTLGESYPAGTWIKAYSSSPHVAVKTWTTFPTGDVTPSVASGHLFKTSGVGQIHDFIDGTEGQEITIHVTAATVVLGHTMAIDDVIKFVRSGSDWLHINR